MILQCNCNHPIQDKLYGKGYRVYNPCKDDNYARCTVCKKEQPTKHQIVVNTKKEEKNV